MQAEVLEVLRQHGGPLSAYQLLDMLRAHHPKIAPPTVYRALATLIERGQIHRLESLNAYMACQCDGHDHGAVLSICDDCGAVGESIAPKIVADLSTLIGATGFAAARHVIEIHGRCADCDTGSSQT